MNVAHLSNIDLNLLVVLDAMLATRSTTAAARKLGRTQSAVSHALARLRDAFGDPLFVRSGVRLEPSTFALSLHDPLAQVLAGVTQIFGGEREVFDPGTLKRSFAIGASDVFGMAALPGIIARIRKLAPGVDLDVRAAVESSLDELLEKRTIDVAYGTRFKTSAVTTFDVGEEDLVLLMRRGHPASARRISLPVYCGLDHIVVAPRGQPGSAIDTVLNRLGRTRRVALRVPHFGTAVLVASRTDLVTALPRSFARALRGVGRLAPRELPFESPRYAFQVAVARPRAFEPAIRWLASELAASIRQSLNTGSRRDP